MAPAAAGKCRLHRADILHGFEANGRRINIAGLFPFRQIKTPNKLSARQRRRLRPFARRWGTITSARWSSGRLGYAKPGCGPCSTDEPGRVSPTQARDMADDSTAGKSSTTPPICSLMPVMLYELCSRKFAADEGDSFPARTAFAMIAWVRCT